MWTVWTVSDRWTATDCLCDPSLVHQCHLCEAEEYGRDHHHVCVRVIVVDVLTSPYNKIRPPAIANVAAAVAAAATTEKGGRV